MLTVKPVASLSACRCGTEISRMSIELIAAKPRSSTRGPEPVALRRRILLQVAERSERRDVAVRGAPAEAELARELADADRRRDRSRTPRGSRGRARATATTSPAGLARRPSSGAGRYHVPHVGTTSCPLEQVDRVGPMRRRRRTRWSCSRSGRQRGPPVHRRASGSTPPAGARSSRSTPSPARSSPTSPPAAARTPPVPSRLRTPPSRPGRRRPRPSASASSSGRPTCSRRGRTRSSRSSRARRAARFGFGMFQLARFVPGLFRQAAALAYAPLGEMHPLRHGRVLDGPAPAGRGRRRDRALERGADPLGALDRGAARARQHRRAEAVRAVAVRRRPALGRDLHRGGAAARACSTSSRTRPARPGRSATSWSRTRTCAGSTSPARPRPGASSPRRPAATSSGSCSSSAATTR